MARDYYDESKPKKKKKETPKPQKVTKSPSVTKVNNKASNSTFMGGGSAVKKVEKAVSNPAPKKTTTTTTRTTMTDAQYQKTYGEPRRATAQRNQTTKPEPVKRTTNHRLTAAQTQKMYGTTNPKLQTAEESRREREERRKLREERRLAGQRQKSGLNDQPTAAQKAATDRAIKNTPGLIKKAGLDAASGYGQTLTDAIARTASSERGTEAKAMKMGIEKGTKQYQELEEERKRTAEEARKDNQSLYQKMQQRQAEWDEKTKDAKGFEKAYYGAVESGTGMLADTAIGLLTGTGQVGALASMGMRTYGSSANQARSEGATETEAAVYGLLQAGKEMGTEMIGGGGLAKMAYGKGALGLGDIATNTLIRNLKGQKADLAHMGVRLLGDVAEENIEEFAGWSLDPLIKEFTYGRNTRERNARGAMQERSDALRAEIQNEDDARAAAAYLSSDDFFEQTVNAYREAGLNKKDAEEVADRMRDYLTASLTGDTDSMEQIEDEVSRKVAGSHNILKDYSFRELKETFEATTLLVGATGLPGNISTMNRGNLVKEQLGAEGVSALANTAIDFEDSQMSTKAKAMKARIDSGKELTGTQVYELQAGMQEQVRKDTEREQSSRRMAARAIENDNLLTPYRQNENGGIDLDEATMAAYRDSANRAGEIIDAIADEKKESITDTQKVDGSKAIAGFQTGVFTVDDANALNYSNTAIRSAFETATGVNLGQYVVKNKDGSVNVPATNTKTKDALFAMAADNLVKSAQAETANWMDNAKGQVVTQVSARMGAQGSAVLQQALDDVDERDRSKYMMTANATDMLYQAARNMGTEWESIVPEATRMFPGISESKLKMMYEAGLADREMANDKARGRQVRMGQALTEMGEQETATGKVFIDTEVPVKGSVIRTFTEIAKNLGADIHFVDYIYDADNNPIEGANGSYDPNTNTFYLNVATGAETNIGYIFMHETTHYLKTYAPEQYQALENLVRERWFAYNPSQMQDAIARKIEAYKRATNGRQVLTEEKALEEIIADASHDFINDPEFAKQVAEEDMGLAKAILDSIRNALRMLRRIFASGSIDDDTHMNSLFRELDIMAEAEKLWLDAYKVAVRNSSLAAVNTWQENANEQSSLSVSEGFTIQDGTARWTDERIDDLIERYGASNPDYSQAYAVLMNPRDFLHITIEDELLRKWRESAASQPEGLTYKEGQRAVWDKSYLEGRLLDDQNFPLDEAELRGQAQTPFLYIRSNKSGQRVLGHEGRHRMRALMEAGVTSVPVVIEDPDTKTSKQNVDSMILGYQEDVYNGAGIVEVNDLVPINESNRDELIQKFGGEAQVRFSMSEPVERVKDLIAVHNLKPENIRNTFELGGFPMPSIAVTKDSMGHDQYGDITLMFHSDTIDPKFFRSNQVFGGDAWTPTFPSIAKKVSRKVADKVDQRLRDILGLGKNDYTLGDLRLPALDDDNLTNALRYNEPYEAFKNDEVFQIAYLKNAKNFDVAVPTKEGKIRNLDKQALEYLDDRLPELTYNDIYDTVDHTMEYEPAVRQARKDYYESKGGVKLKALAKHLDEKMGYSDVIARLEATIKFRENGIPEITDQEALRSILNEKVDQEGYKAWIDDLFDGIIEKTGIRNDKDMFTSSGKRRSWESLHDPVTLENVVKVMRTELAAGGTGIFGSNPKGAAQKQYKSLDEIRADEDRLQKLSEEEYKAQSEEAVGKMSEVCVSIAEHNPKRFSNSFGAALDVGSDIAEILNSTRKRSTIQSKLKKDYLLDVTDEQMDDLMEAIDAIANLPTGYFEAKPRRAVGFDEVRAAIIPQNTDEDIKIGLSERGITSYEYDPDVEGDRTAKVNEAADAQNLRFSITDSEGNILSEGQATFFADSKMVDAEGKLKPMYHGTQNEFFEFDITKAYPGTLGRGFYFSDSDSHAGVYGKTNKYYLNLVNPLMPGTNIITKDQLHRFVSELAEDEDYGLENYGYGATVDSVVDSIWGKSDFAMLRDLNLTAVGDFAEALKVFNRVNDTDYDGIITDTETLAFYPQQVKSVDNLNPTLSKDTRYSITDSDGKELTDGQVEYFKNSQARDDQGRLVPVYHTTNKGGFTIFDPTYSDDRRSLFFSDDWDVSQTYGNYANSRFYYFDIDTIDDVKKYLDVYSPDRYFVTEEQFEQAGGWEADFIDFENVTNGKQSDFEKYLENPDGYFAIVGVPDYTEGHSSYADRWILADSPDDLLKELHNAMLRGERDIGESHGYYACYLNLENPMIIDAKGQYWNSIKEDGFNQISVLKIGNSYDIVADGYPISLSDARAVYGDEMVDQIEEFDKWESGEYHDFYTWNGAAFDPEEEGHWPMEGNTRFWANEAEAYGCDGLIIYNLIDLGGKSEFEGSNELSTIYIAFSSNQVKDINNENPTENPDIRYSFTDDDEAMSHAAHDYAYDTSYEALSYYESLIDTDTSTETTYEKAKKYIAKDVDEFYSGLTRYADGMKFDDPVLEEGRVRMARSKQDYFNSNVAKWNEAWLTEGEVLDPKSVKKPVRDLVTAVMQESDTTRKYKSELVNKAIIDMRLAYYYAKQGRTDVADALLWHSAHRMIDGVEFYADDSMYEEYKGLRDYLKTARIQLGEEYWSDADYGAFRKANFGRINLVQGSTNVDQIYQELEELFPGLFDSEEYTTPPDQLMHIAAVLDSIQPYKEAYSSEQVAELATDIASDLLDIMQNGKELQSIADKYKNRYEARVKAMKARHAEAMLKVRQQRDKGIKAEKAKFKEYVEKQREKKFHSKYFNSIEKSYKKLTERLLTNTADKNIPEQYKKELAKVLAAFDLQTVGSKKYEARTGRKGQKSIKMATLKVTLGNIENKSGEFHVSDAITDIIDELLGKNVGNGSNRSIEGLTIDELNSSELARIDKLLKALLHEFNTYKTVKINTKRQQVKDIGQAQVESALEHAKTFGSGHDYYGFHGWVDRILNMDELTPAYLFRRIDPNKEGMALMYEQLEDSHDRYIRNTVQLTEWIDEIVGEYHHKGLLKKDAGVLEDWRSENYAQDFVLANGHTITLTPAQMMSVYCLSKRAQAYNHMTGAGIVVAPVSYNAKILSDLKKKAKVALPEVLTDSDIKLITTQLSQDQMKVADKLQNLMADKMAAWGNEASMNVLGIELFGEPDYFPIKSDKAGLISDLSEDQFVEAIRSFGFTKAVQPGARNAIMVEDIFDVIAQHCNNMNLYNAYSEAINDFMKVYNYRNVSEEGEYTVKQAIGHAYSQKATNFIMSFMKDLNGNVSNGRSTGINDAFNDSLAKAKKASVFANIRVAAQQPTAIGRAFAVISPKYASAMLKPDRGILDEMFEHCPIAKWKSLGYYDINMGRSIEDVIMNNNNVIEEAATWAYGALDNLTWGGIWQMVKAETEDKHPKVEKGSDEYWDLCNRRMREVVAFTQVVDSPFHRSHAMRSKNFMDKLATAFGAEPTLTYNMVRDGYIRAKEMVLTGDKVGATKVFGRTMSVFVFTAGLTAAAAAFADVLRGKNPGGDGDDDDEITLLQKWWANTLANWKDNVNLLNNIYYVKDIMSLLDGWQINNLAFQGWKYIGTGLQQLYGSPYARSKDSWWKNFAYGVGYLTGVPVKTVMTDFGAVFNKAKSLFGFETPILDAYLESLDAIADKKDESNAATETSMWSLIKENTLDKAAEKMGYRPKETTSDNLSASTKSESKGKAEKAGAETDDNTSEAASDNDALKAIEEKAEKKAAGLSGDELDTVLWDTVMEGYTKRLDAGDMDYIEHLELIYMNNGGDLDKFHAKLKDSIDSAYKKTLKDDMSKEDINKQWRMRMKMQSLGYTDQEISEICYHSEKARDLKAAMRIGVQEYINDELSVLVQAGLTRDDYEKLYKYRNYGAKSYDGKYTDPKYTKTTGRFIWPTDGQITSYFGYRNAPTAGASSNHPAIDIGAAMGSEVVASDGGVVITAGWNGGYGNSVGIKHANGMVTYYNHLSAWNVKVGDQVAQGQPIANVGSTGISTGPHLDFKILDADGEPVDPLKYLSSRS